MAAQGQRRKTMPTPARLTRRSWILIVVLGLTGQLAWTIENMYLNVFVYDTITDDPTVLAALVAASAVAATVATFIAGAWSDRLGNRRRFIAAGYILWGLSTAAFGLVDITTAAALLPAVNSVVVAIAAIVALDCVMSALGATANDAAFNAWVTDTTTRPTGAGSTPSSRPSHCSPC
ncbi:MFS transporter [Tessaracoccus coleopterorum]|uniref:MFS transporter n=1 Tax=Tessaracoccus coleopterorum TaxID=2714950 RepID=UPI001E2973A6|nr:MFS transporter [Tessaracoccus coleopterorum]